MAGLSVAETDRGTIGAVLESFRGDVCTRCSICDRYSDALNKSNFDLMNELVLAIVLREVNATSPIRRHFDGSGDGANSAGVATNFVADLGSPASGNQLYFFLVFVISSYIL